MIYCLLFGTVNFRSKNELNSVNCNHDGEEDKDFMHRQMSVTRGSSLLDPIKLAYKPYWLDGWLRLIANAFNHLHPVCQQSWSQGTLLHRTRRFFPSGGRNHHRYSLNLPTEGWLGRVDPSFLGPSSFPVLTGLDVAQLC